MSVRVMGYVWEHSTEREEGLLVLLALADFADDDGLCWPSVEMIAKQARITVRGATGVLARLEASGQIRRRVGRGRGIRSVYVVVTDKNPNVVPVSLSDARSTKTRRTRGQNPNVETEKPERGRAGKGEPPKEPSAEPSKVSMAAAAAIPPKSVQEEQKAQLREASDIWLDGRARAHLRRFTDARALGGLRVSVMRALTEGVDWRDIVRGLERHFTDPKANTWYADEWARRARYDREERERFERALAKRNGPMGPDSGLHQIWPVARREIAT